ncbi:aerobic-type carbon monoxide dehydrogenase, middle subunit CoxM/CutM-like protein [Halobacteroides halobius DSM 5150]|uniref:Aerobic-type carbon monoxide dehydrogenase, middle subunit CoxM/CutM-like protein n=1 Tax=Halobacteroides halobius (strain ATCC 35273 / DSM 5150 / MD-1) TaxID=748449 RepID=L0K8Y2_HALHC|nr:FAD binding domain-containing protein [Halobacteroides halobius]AGB41005.1 aerobic-type carbon monoxide dehydrogenase, middle subunit CoxM/CutM-like protein [Halobacteroides halobius DSM 5150]
MLKYEFLTTKELDQALDYLKEYDNVEIIAGGTDVLVNMHNQDFDNSNLDYVLDISNLKGLDKIKKEEEYIKLGPLVTHANIMKNPIIQKEYPLLAKAASTIGSTQIRNRATVGGNIINASPAADLLPPLIALDAKAVLESQTKRRVLPLSNLVTGPYRTDIKSNEILTELKIPLDNQQLYGNFQKIGRRKALAIARLNLALVTKVDANQFFADTRLVPGAATPSPQRFEKLEAAIDGEKIADINLEEIGRLAHQEMVSITGERWSTPYKKPAIATLVQRALREIIKEVNHNE